MKLAKYIGILLTGCIVAALVAACASMGRPEGGPRDETPPVFVRSNPMPGALNVKNKRIDIYFDENVQVQDAMNKVVVSPAQVQMPAVSANGRRLTIELRDSLIPNTTYTLDFSDAIRDLNEGNILDGFATDFSTGDVLDTLSISGMVLEARTLEPAQGMLVGVYSNLADSAFTTLPLQRIAKTNQYGQFTVRNLAPGAYRIFALNDMNRDYKFDRTEDVAFYDTIIMPSVSSVMVKDTLRSSLGTDSIVERTGYKYLPNDILLTWFNENYKSQYLKNSARVDSTRFRIEFGAPSDTFPVITLANTRFAGDNLLDHAVLEYSQVRDTLTYWLRTPELIDTDSIFISMSYPRTDTLSQISWTTDTLKMFKPKASTAKKPSSKEKKKLMTAQDSINARTTFLTMSTGRTTQELNMPLRLTFSEPIETIDRSGLHLQMQRDTIWTDVELPVFALDSVNRILEYSSHVKWNPGAKYRITADTMAVHSIYGHFNRPFKQEFTVKKEEDYSMVSFRLIGAPGGAPLVVELLNSSDKPVRKAIATNGMATFDFVPAGTYYARAFEDRNANGTWDTGNLGEKLQPEDTWYYPKAINVKSNWDIQNDWNLNDLALDKQKPLAIKKNKPKTKDNQQTTTEDEDEDDMFFNPENPFDNKKQNPTRINNTNPMDRNNLRRN